MGEPSKGDTSVIEDDSLVWSKEHSFVEPYPEETTFEELCNEDVMSSVAPNIGLINSICIEPLDLIPISSPVLPSRPLCIHFTSL